MGRALNELRLRFPLPFKKGDDTKELLIAVAFISYSRYRLFRSWL